MILVTTSKLAKCLLFALLCLSFVTFFVIGDAGIPCEKIECGCVFKDKSGTYEISMKNISKHGSPSFKIPGDVWNYDIDPCYGFTKDAMCKDVTMCQYSSSYGEFPVAKYDILKYSDFVADKSKPITVTYSPVTGHDGKTRQMEINLKCSKATHPKVSQKQGKIIVFTVDISSPSLCPKAYQTHGSSGGRRLSTGSVMVIIFFGLLVVYVVAGMLFMKYRRGATGKEIIPNIEFWSSLPGLIKDGCVFFGKNMKELCGRCCQREGYSEI